jgi:hypothetical protein
MDLGDDRFRHSGNFRVDSFFLEPVKQNPRTFDPISLTDRRKKEGLGSLVRQKADKIVEMADF